MELFSGIACIISLAISLFFSYAYVESCMDNNTSIKLDKIALIFTFSLITCIVFFTVVIMVYNYFLNVIPFILG